MLTPNLGIYLVSGITDMRKSIDGLSLIVADVLEMDPFSEAWFIFCNRGRDKIKILFWDTNGFWLYYRRLEKGRFNWPKPNASGHVAISMQIKRDFDYYHNLHNVITHALLHLLCKVSASPRFVPVATRNEILIKYLKPKLNDKSLSNIKKDIKLMLSVARKKGGNLEMKLHQLSTESNQTKLVGAEKLYNLLIHLYDEEGIESRIFEEGSEAEPGILYMLEDQVEHSFDQEHNQVTPLSMLIQLERAPELINSINAHGLFLAEMKEWNAELHQAHILVHPA